MKLFFSIIIIFLTFNLSFAQFCKPLSLPTVISNNMVFQQNRNVPIWGWTSSNEEVTIKASWLENSVTVKADESGNWDTKLQTDVASNKQYSLSVISKRDTINITNILFGEVWLASGQSNMQMPLKGWSEQNVEGSEEAIKKSYNSQIRLFQVKQNASPVPLDNCKGSWVESNPEEVASFSAAAYFFAAKLNRDLNIPIGIIHSSWGGTKAQSWVRKERLLEIDDFNDEIKDLDLNFRTFTEEIVEFEATMKKWGEFERYDPTINYSTYMKMNEKVQKKWENLKSSEESYCKSLDDYPKPNMPEKFPQFMVTTLYNAMIHPLIPFTIKGVIWYQGESNANKPDQYAQLFPLLINNWRSDWKQGDFPFYYVQIAPFLYKDDDEGSWYPAALRDVQRQTMNKVINTGMVVTTDIADTNRIHPPKKREVGERLALWALAKNYNKDIVYSGPIYKSMKIKENKIRLFFEYAESGLLCKGESLTYFEIADEDGNYIDAKAEIDGKTVLVSSPEVENPKSVRFGWKHTAQPNLFNKAGLPASPFYTKSLSK
ncbi:MAG: sialate O-acetylesterase [Bacteroidota bacterium]